MRPLAAFIIILLFGCSSNNNEKKYSEPIGAKIGGTWKSKSLKVEITTLRNTETDSTIFFDYSLSSSTPRPISMSFNEDGTYQSFFLQSNTDTIKYYGDWRTSYDSLIITYHEHRNVYVVRFEDNFAYLEGTVDYDRDLKKDDVVTTTLVRLN